MKQKNTKLISARESKGYTQQYVADSINISLRQYQRYENEEKIPNVITSKRLSNILNASIESLF